MSDAGRPLTIQTAQNLAGGGLAAFRTHATYVMAIRDGRVIPAPLTAINPQQIWASTLASRMLPEKAMSRSFAASLATLSLLCLAGGCTDPAGEDSDGGSSTDFELPDFGSSSSGEPDEPPPPDDESGSDSDSATGADEDVHPGCVDRNPDFKGAISFDFGAWGSPHPALAPAREINAVCAVTSFEWVEMTAQIALECTEGDLLDQPISASLELYADPSLEVTAGQKVMFVGGWHYQPAGELAQYFILRNTDDSRVLLAGLLNMVDDVNDKLSPLSLELTGETCPWVCEADCADGGDPGRRDVIRVSHEAGPSADVLDGNRATLQHNENAFEFVAGRAFEFGFADERTFDTALVIATKVVTE